MLPERLEGFCGVGHPMTLCYQSAKEDFVGSVTLCYQSAKEDSVWYRSPYDPMLPER